MHLRKVTLFNFKNYTQASFDFSEGINCIVGENGSGKTNLIDAVYFLCLTKSAFQSSDSLVVKEGEEIASIRGQFHTDKEEYSVHCKFGDSIKKTISCNDEVYEKLSDHIGRFTSVLIHPHDVDYVRMGSDMRRRLIDGVLCQVDHRYLENLIKYNRLLKQRNYSLKSMREKGSRDTSLLETYDKQIMDVAPYIINRRKSILDGLSPVLQELYADLSDHKEKVDIKYEPSSSAEELKNNIELSRMRDIEAARSLVGPHRDEFVFLIDEHELKNFGSQGQQKSFILSLKLSFLSVMDNQPLLLLDDIFDRLDSGRIVRLMQMIHNMGLQSFITDARPERVEELLKEIKLKANTIYI